MTDGEKTQVLHQRVRYPQRTRFTLGFFQLEITQDGQGDRHVTILEHVPFVPASPEDDNEEIFNIEVQNPSLASRAC